MVFLETREGAVEPQFQCFYLMITEGCPLKPNPQAERGQGSSNEMLRAGLSDSSVVVVLLWVLGMGSGTECSV